MNADNPADFTGRAVLVTGGTKGIGRVVAETFLAAGAQVTVCARSAPDSPVGADGREARFLPVDVRDADAVKAMVADASSRMGRLDVLINNAGGSPDADAATVSPRFVDKIVALNLLAPFYVAQAVNAVMQQQDSGGSIVNIGSVSAHDPQPGTAAYSAAKAGLLVLTKALALEWAPKVRVNHITTGLIRTEAAASVYGEDGGAAVTRTLPIGRMAVPSDIAGACLFLGGSLSAYVNGADLAVHGGGEYPARYLATHPETN
ncbi:SDR family oxidoreductase [Rhodococcus sp. NPDC003318]|uniref:SDR family oxidoreductase n=1 Tax=Rhodococcus sp. NPDC003318 TaxID=3364503 RepID=UPI0036987B73